MTTWTRWLWMLALLLAATSVQAGTKYYYYTDAQGTVLAKADAQGNIVASYDYTPYGVQVLGTSPSGPTGYTGHVNDAESGFVYMQQRYYDPVVGRFLSVDPVEPVTGELFGFGRYGYANNNPYRFTDPDGRQSVGEMIDSAAEGCGAVSCAGYAVLSAAWKVLGAEGASQIADKGWSNTSGVGKAGAVLEVAAVLPPIKLLRGAEVAVKEAVPAIKGMTGHAVDQAINRGVKPIQILDAVKNPLKVAEVKVDALGRASQKVVGQTATVIVNPTTSKVVTIYPTSTKVAEKLMKETE